MALTVTGVERTAVKLPYRDRPWEAGMARQHGPWNYFEVVELELSDGSVGVGERSLGWPLEDPGGETERVLGAPAASLLYDGSLSRGVQHAAFDAVGRSLGVPVHELLGEQVREETPLAWWCIDMPKEAWLAECETAIERGYRAVKLKGRPWRDVREQVRYLAEHLPEWFEIGIDFNATLLDADRAIPVLEDIDRHPQLESVEGPIPYGDVAGGKRIQAAIGADVTLHYGTPAPETAVCEGFPDGFVFYGAPPAESMAQAAVAATGGVPGFLQYPGTGLTAAFALHYGAVFDTATMPGVSTYELYEHSLLAGGFVDVADGAAAVPDGPGLGYRLDRDAVAAFAVDPPREEPNPPVLTEVRWPDGRRAYMASNSQTGDHGKTGALPFYERGVTTRLVPDDGSEAWRTRYERALADEPYFEDGDPPGFDPDADLPRP